MEVHPHTHTVLIVIRKKRFKHYLWEFLMLFLAVCCFNSSRGQPLPDSVLTRYNSVHTQKEKGKYLSNYLQSVLSNDSNSVNHALEILAYFNKQKDEAASDYIQLYIANNLNRKGDYSTGLNMALLILPRFEKRKDTAGIIYSLKTIYNCFDFAKNYEQSTAYQKKSIPIIAATNDEVELANIYNDLGAVYAKALMPDSGILYAQKAVSIDTRLKNEYNLVFSLSTLAENYLANKDYDLALPFLRKVLSYEPSRFSAWATAFTYTDLAQAFLGLKQYDSSNFYAQKAIQWSNYMGFKETLINSYECLYKSFEASGKPDSVNKYFRLAITAKDSVYSIEKTNNIQAISFREQLRQQEIETEKTKAEEERKNNIQYAAIAAGLILFISLFLLLSRSIIVNEKWISFLGILGLLIVFEFINLFFHPYIARLTNHSPALMLVVLVVIAALLIPLHNRIEHWIKHKMVEKNKKIRLTAAKKTIEQLENKNP